jgi:hypothetical protein
MKNFKEFYMAVCFTLMTGGVCFICTQVLKISVIETKVDNIKTQIDEVSVSVDAVDTITQDNRGRIIYMEAKFGIKKGAVTIKNSESLINYLLPKELKEVDNKRVDNVANSDIIKFN